MHLMSQFASDPAASPRRAEEGSLCIQGQGSRGGSVVSGVFNDGVEMEDGMGVGFLHAGFLDEVRGV